jgi:DNA polymerase elongation subunit (family B)
MENYSKLSTDALLEKKKNLERLVSKYSNMQNGKKVQLNSAYGALGNAYFRYFDVRLAEAVTLSGQLAIKWVQRDLNLYLNKLLNASDKDFIVASDTDSAYITLNEVVNKTFDNQIIDQEKIVEFIDVFCVEGLQKVINNSFNSLYEYTNGFLPRLEMKRECIANTGIWIAKKRYVISALDVEGIRYSAPVIKATGLDVVKSSTPAFIKIYLNEALKILLQGKESDLQKHMKAVKNIFFDADIDNISFPKSVSGVKKYSNRQTIYTKSTPINSRAAILYNYLITKHGLQSKYEPITEGEKIKYVYLKEPNPIGENVIGYIDKLPDEFGLLKYVDYDLQFNKIFKKPIEDIATIIGWSLEKKSTLF